MSLSADGVAVCIEGEGHGVRGMGEWWVRGSLDSIMFCQLIPLVSIERGVRGEQEMDVL